MEVTVKDIPSAGFVPYSVTIQINTLAEHRALAAVGLLQTRDIKEGGLVIPGTAEDVDELFDAIHVAVPIRRG